MSAFEESVFVKGSHTALSANIIFYFAKEASSAQMQYFNSHLQAIFLLSCQMLSLTDLVLMVFFV